MKISLHRNVKIGYLVERKFQTTNLISENPYYTVVGRSIPYPIRPGLNNTPSSFNQFSPSGQPHGRDGLAPSGVGQPVASYLRGSDKSPLNPSTNDITDGDAVETGRALDE